MDIQSKTTNVICRATLLPPGAGKDTLRRLIRCPDWIQISQSPWRTPGPQILHGRSLTENHTPSTIFSPHRSMYRENQIRDGRVKESGRAETTVWRDVRRARVSARRVAVTREERQVAQKRPCPPQAKERR